MPEDSDCQSSTVGLQLQLAPHPNAQEWLHSLFSPPTSAEAKSSQERSCRFLWNDLNSNPSICCFLGAPNVTSGSILLQDRDQNKLLVLGKSCGVKSLHNVRIEGEHSMHASI